MWVSSGNVVYPDFAANAQRCYLRGILLLKRLELNDETLTPAEVELANCAAVTRSRVHADRADYRSRWEPQLDD